MNEPGEFSLSKEPLGIYTTDVPVMISKDLLDHIIVEVTKVFLDALEKAVKERLTPPNQ